MKPLKIGSRIIGHEDLFFVVEEGQANQGDINIALNMIELASNSGADAIEFQLAKADDFYIKNHEGHSIYLKREFDKTQLKELCKKAQDYSLEVIAVPLSHNLIGPLVNYGCSAFNINASDLTNPMIIDTVVDSGLPFFLSLPLATIDEIDWAINRIRKKTDNNFILLHGQHPMAISNQGVSIEHTNLGFITTLKKEHDLPVGFIDHTNNKWTPSCAVAAGAVTISKHLTWSRKARGPDWNICLEPDEMKESISEARLAYKSINSIQKEISQEENLDRSVMRRSIVANKKIEKGKKISEEDICFKRPGLGVEPSRYMDVIGKRVKREILPDEMILFSDLEEK